MDYKAVQIEKIITCESSLLPLPQLQIQHVYFDTRLILNPQNSIFCALSGPTRNGTNFINLAIKKGVKNILTTQIPEEKINENINYFIVKNTLSALQQLAVYHRKNLSTKVVGITGSNGKTTVKEWLFQCSTTFQKTYRSPASYNSQLGVALSILGVDNKVELAIIEAGISQKGEMELLEKMVVPDLGILTNIGDAHQNNFSSKEEKLKEKMALFSNCKVLVTHQELAETIVKYRFLANKEIYSWGPDANNNLIAKIEFRDNSAVLILKDQELIHELIIPSSDKATIENILTVISTLRCLEYPWENIIPSVNKLETLPMRMELKEGINGNQIIDDSYSFDLNSIKIAIEKFSNIANKEHKKTIILSDLDPQVASPEIYAQIFELLSNVAFQNLILIGYEMKNYLNHYKGQAKTHCFTDIKTLEQSHLIYNLANEKILIKGSRRFTLDQLVRNLSKSQSKTTLEVNLSALADNLNIYKNSIKSEVKIMAVLKAQAYGSGTDLLASFFNRSGIHMFAVAVLEEALDLQSSGINQPILILNPGLDDVGKAVQNKLRLELSNESMLNTIKKQSVLYPEVLVHLKLDTGMSRLGFQEDAIDWLIEELKNSNIKVEGIFTHLSSSDDPSADHISKNQLLLFDKLFSKICSGLEIQPEKHALNSSGALRFKEHDHSMVRLGLGLYGLTTSKERLGFTATHTLKTSIIQIKQVKAGSYIGYGTNTRLQSDAIIAIIGIGYADGLFRSAGNGNLKVMIQGELAPTIGDICMDLTIIDITALSNCYEGQEVVIFSPKHSIRELAKACNTIPYEILSRISPRVRRLYVYQ